MPAKERQQISFLGQLAILFKLIIFGSRLLLHIMHDEVFSTY